MHNVKPFYHAVLVTRDVPETGYPLVGRIYGDKHTHGNHPFQDGTRVYTSPVKVIEGNLVSTQNTVYLIKAV